MKKLTVTLICIVTAMQGFSFSILAAPPYKSYNYVGTNNGIFDVAAPDAYLPEKILGSQELGIPDGAYEDMCIDTEFNHYIVDSVNNSFYIFDKGWKLKKSVAKFMYNKAEESFNAPTGIFVAKGGDIYVADTNNSRIVVFDPGYNVKAIINAPKSEVLDETFVFKPLKLAVSNSGRIFVIAKDVYEGLMELTLDGQFLGFIGSNKVIVSPIELFWKKIFSQKQNDASKAFIPVEYTNLSLDTYGFIYAVTSVKDVDAPIKRLNPSGADILVRKPVISNLKVAGDYIADSGTTNSSSAFIDIVSDDDNGIYYVLDTTRGHVFCYDADGNILYIFGGLGSDQRGTFMLPSAIELENDRVLVLDKGANTVTIFKTTDYAETLKKALFTYANGEYETSLQLWDKVLEINCNLSLAYVKSGFCLYRMGQYKAAMDHFILANAREQYSKAFVKYSRAMLAKNFGYYMTAAVLIAMLIIGLIVFRKARKNKKPGRKMQ